MLPKVFMKTGQQTVFGISKDELLDLNTSPNFKHRQEFNWVRQITVYFYNSLSEFRRRCTISDLIQNNQTAILNTNIGQQEYSYLDLLLTFVNFYKKNKNNILYKQIEFKSRQLKKVRWEKTIQKSTPLLTANKQPVYTVYRNKKKIVNKEEELLTYFFSILNHFNTEHQLYLQIDKSYRIISGTKFKLLQKNGLSKLRKIKYRYFDDTLKKMYHLCEIYFSQTDKSSIKKKHEEFVVINNYNIVFENMIDKLFSDTIENKTTSDGVSLTNLKYNKDGKIIDHIYDYQSLIDTSNIFYIGDSKYYKSDNIAGKVSKYKQFTYAKNVIQYNIDLLNEGKYYRKNLRYRDELTEGYNITPNFFIYGYINDYRDFDNELLEEKGEIIKSFHFEERLFDRDTLFVHQYKINFLYVLKAYSQFTNRKIESFRKNTKKRFRDNFVNFFNDKEKSKFVLFEYINADIEDFVETNFRKINGKSYKTNTGKLILAQYEGDESLVELLDYFKEFHIV